MTRVVVTDHVFPGLEVERSVLRAVGAEVLQAPRTDEATLKELARDSVALLVCYASVSAAVIEAAAEGGCRVIARYGIGYDNVDVDAASAAGIAVTNVPDYCLGEVADHTMALLLSLSRGVVSAALEVKGGGWPAPGGALHRMAGRRLALIGFGGVGRLVADRARAFGIDVVVYDPYLGEAEFRGLERADTLAAALADVDYVSLHVPLTPESSGLIGEEAIAAMRRAPVLVNTSRGGLVDLEAVTRALADGRLSGAALDATEPEPLPVDHPLRRHPSAVVTPHMAFYSIEAQAELQRRAAEEVARGVRGEPLRHAVNGASLRGPSA